MSVYLSITPCDPLIARDGRPFGVGQGARMKSLDWFYPSVAAGSLRTLLGKQTPNGFDAITVANLKTLHLAGPLPLYQDELYFPAPHDCYVWQNDQGRRKVAALRPAPLQHGEGCDFPNSGLLPVIVPDATKPAGVAAWWSHTQIIRWLCGEMLCPPDKTEAGFWSGPEKDARTHAAIAPDSGMAEEGMLFQTVGLDFALQKSMSSIQLTLRVEQEGAWGDSLRALNVLHPMGGERRLAHWCAGNAGDWRCPQEIKDKLKGAKRVRMVLATPAYFSEGWMPHWLDASSLTGTLPNTNVQLKLVSACVRRWLALSGWSLEKGSFGEKPVKRLVPAGSVYFFEVIDGDPELLSEHWLRPVSDDDDMNYDGFGLALWGTMGG